jgi:hypothetical protein
MDRTAAIKVAAEYVRRLGRESHLDLALDDAATQEREVGWVFFPTRRALAGNAPFIVDRTDGSIHPTGTALPLEDYLAAFVKSCSR